LSWESWNRRLAEERQKLQEAMESFYAKHLSDGQEWVQALISFEDSYSKHLAEHANAAEDYRITSRQIRGWDRVYEKWNKLPESADESDLRRAMAEVQRKMPHGFGDAMVFQFLAKPENWFIWKGHPERLIHYTAYNKLRKKLDHAKEQATFTLPDAIRHPLWARYDARGGDLHSYTIRMEDKKHLYVTFGKMLWPTENGWEERKEIEVALAPSKQVYHKGWRLKVHENPVGKQEVVYVDYSSQLPLEGVLGGAKIQFDRSYIEKRKQTVASGDVGSVFLNVSVELNSLQEMKNGRLQTPIGQALKVIQADWPKVIDYRPKELLDWLQHSPETTEKGIDAIATGMRIMTVDLGQRTSAAVSIFEVVNSKPDEKEGKLYYPIQETGLYAVHQRSLLLELPGENVSKESHGKRAQRWNDRKAVRSQVRLLSDIMRLHTRDSADSREHALQELLQAVQLNQYLSDSEKTIWQAQISTLNKEVGTDVEGWKQALITVHRNLEPLVGQTVSHWRKTLSQDRRHVAGLSMWNIEELEETRKLLVSWSKRSRIPGEVNRIERFEAFGKRQLEHLQHVKDDRLKQMANLIVMTALGYRYDKAKKCWVADSPSCQVILFEDLNRYRFNQDRSRRENSKLMKWAHRSIPKLVYMQGEPYGLQVGDVYSAYSSKFHAKTGAPGIRCRALSAKDISKLKVDSDHEGHQNHSIRKALVDGGFLREDQLLHLKPGDLVPWEGGEIFVTLAAPFSDRLIKIHADINAAQNLQKRFWQQKSELFRVPCQTILAEEGDYLVPHSPSTTVQKYLGKGRFVKSGLSDNLQVYKWENSTKMRVKTTSTSVLSEMEDMEDFEQSLEEAKEIRGDYKTLFRDPSGFFFDQQVWVPQKEYWGVVRSMLEKRLRETILKRVEV
jgi:hypothetical protein